MEIKRSRVQCLKCFKILESKHRHDFRKCGCPQETMIDGGKDYIRYGGVDMKAINILTEYKKDDEKTASL